MSGDYREKFQNAMKKEIQNNIDTGAYEPISIEESEQVRLDMPEKVLQSRYVLVEKPIEESDVAKAKADKILLADNGELSTKAKARHVMKGFSEWDAEGTSTFRAHLKLTHKVVGFIDDLWGLALAHKAPGISLHAAVCKSIGRRKA